MDYDAFSKIAADSIDRLRGCDVFRLLDTVPSGHIEPLGRWITKHRPDLRHQVALCQAELSREGRS